MHTHVETTNIHAHRHTHVYALQDVNPDKMELTDTALTLKQVVTELISVGNDLVGWDVLESQLEVVHVCCCAKDIAIARLSAAMEKVQDSNCKQSIIVSHVLLCK